MYGYNVYQHSNKVSLFITNSWCYNSAGELLDTELGETSSAHTILLRKMSTLDIKTNKIEPSYESRSNEFLMEDKIKGQMIDSI